MECGQQNKRGRDRGERPIARLYTVHCTRRTCTTGQYTGVHTREDPLDAHGMLLQHAAPLSYLQFARLLVSNRCSRICTSEPGSASIWDAPSPPLPLRPLASTLYLNRIPYIRIFDRYCQSKMTTDYDWPIKFDRSNRERVAKICQVSIFRVI